MDPSSARALSALEPFLALAKTATSPIAAADLITRATSHSQTYVFAELLETPNIQALRRAEEEKYRVYLTLLGIFCWGTWADYESNPNLPRLNPAQTTKLQHLTLLTLCATHPNSSLSYSYLQRSLSLPTQNATTLESLATTAITAGLIHAKLSPRTSTLLVSSVAPLRDLRPGSVWEISRILGDWEGRCSEVASGIEAEIRKVRQEAELRAWRKRERETRIEGVVKADPSFEANGGGLMIKDGVAGSKKKREFAGMDGAVDGEWADEVDDVTGGGVKSKDKDVVDLTESGMDIDDAPPTEEEKSKGKGKTSGGKKQKALGPGKRGRDD